MQTLTRRTLLIAGIGLMAVPAWGQSRDPSINEAQLSQLGLTVSWRGQAVMEAGKDRLQFLTVDEQNIYAQSRVGLITAFSGETGRRHWSQLLTAPNQQGFPVATTDEMVIAAIGMKVFGLDKTTGALRWQLQLQEHPSTAPESDGNRLFVGCVDGSVFAFDVQRIRKLWVAGMLPQWTARAQLWQMRTQGEIVSPPILSGPLVSFASKTGTVYGVTAAKKELQYQFESDGRIRVPLGHTRDLLFVADMNSRLYCIQQSTGRIRWQYTSGAPLGLQPRAIGRHVFVSPVREGLAAVSVSNGRVEWQQREATSLIAASDTKVYATDGAGNMLVLSRENGRILGSLNIRPFPVHVENDRTDRIVLATEGGQIFSLREVDAPFPTFHMNPERRPILPELAPDSDNDSESSQDV